MELCKGGELFDEITRKAQRGMSEATAGRMVRVPPGPSQARPRPVPGPGRALERALSRLVGPYEPSRGPFRPLEALLRPSVGPSKAL